MADVYLVTRVRGPAWDWNRRLRAQGGWVEHAAFMDGLADEGFVVLGGPVGEGDGDSFLFVVAAATEDDIRARFEQDPWEGTMLAVASVRPWSVWLRRAAFPG
jgi:uncharacterized protein YciI